MSLWIRNPTKSQSGRSQVRMPVLKRDASVMLKTVFSVLSYSVSLDSLEPKKMLNSLYFMCQGQLWVCRCRSRWPRNKEELRGASTHRALQSHREWLTQDGISQICLEFRLCHMGSDKTEMQNRIRNHSKLWMKTGKFCSRNYEVERPRIEKWGAPQRQLPLFP